MFINSHPMGIEWRNKVNFLKRFFAKNLNEIYSEYIIQAVAKAARAAIETIAMASTARAENLGPRISGTIMKKPTLDRYAKDKYAELRNFKLEVKTCSKSLI